MTALLDLDAMTSIAQEMGDHFLVGGVVFHQQDV